MLSEKKSCINPWSLEIWRIAKVRPVMNGYQGKVFMQQETKLIKLIAFQFV